MNSTVGIIGAGFAGTVVAANLVNKASKPLTIYLIESSQQIPKGIAFSTDNPKHLLNVRACSMGALSQEPDGFCQWLSHHEKTWRPIDPYFSSLTLNPDNYYPRKLYGMFLEDLLQHTKAIAHKKGIQLKLIPQKAQDIQWNGNKTFTVLCKDQALSCDFIVLATGIPPFKRLPFETPSLLSDKRYTANIWDSPTSVLNQNSPDTGKKTILIIGSGLTMVDAVTSLVHQNFKGHILVLSSSGRLPEVHETIPKPALPLNIKPKPLLRLLKEVRAEIKEAAASNINWRAVVDGLRPSIPLLWHHLSLRDQKKFLRFLFTIWNKHRHRMSLESKEILDQLLNQRRLELHSAHILQVDNSDPQQIKVKALLHDNNQVREWDVQNVINCTGPDYKIANQQNQLLEKLHAKGMINWDPLEMGLATKDNKSLQGNNGDKMYALGSLLFGERLETTAVPEIRQQAAAIADMILQHQQQ